MSQAPYCLSSDDAGGNRPRPPSLDFHGERKLDWDEIEMQLHYLTTRAQAVEWMGREATDSVHGQNMGPVFDQIAADMAEHIANLQMLLGLRGEAQS
jgi:hypothetical protein